MMDPNANLREQCEIAKSLLNNDFGDDGCDVVDALRLAELVVALDEWLSNGNAKPAAWNTSDRVIDWGEVPTKWEE